MPKQVIDDAIWKSRFDIAEDNYKFWANLFKCDTLEKYYESKQWTGMAETYNPYVINKFYETIQIKLAEFIPTAPRYLVAPKPGNADYDLQSASSSAQLKEDILNTLVADNRKHFSSETKEAYKDHFFRFAIIEVGYGADWVRNPNAQHPTLAKHVDENPKGKPYKVVNEPEELPVNERVFIKHISAKRFRVGGIDSKYLDRCDWFGYYEYVDPDDLLSLKLMNFSKVKESLGTTNIGAAGTKRAVKIWHVWDTRTKLRLVILDNEKITIAQSKYDRIPLFDYRPNLRVVEDDRANNKESDEGFYPIPPSFYWLSPQDEINETREMLRAHRRRFKRKYIATGEWDDEELNKIETGEDGAIARSPNPGATLVPIQDANLGSSLDKTIVTSADDLNKISGTSGEDRGVADRTTATQANIIALKGKQREATETDQVKDWMAAIGREILMTVKDKFSIGTWALLTSDTGDFMGEMRDNPGAYQFIKTEQINDGYDFRIDVDVTSLSSGIQQEEKRKFLEFLSILTQFPAISFSPTLVMEAAYRVGYRNQKVIKEMMKMALLQEMGRQAQMQQAGLQTPNNGNAPQQITAAQTPNDSEQIRNQLQNQVGPTVQ